MTESRNIQQRKKFEILLLGDNCIDIYQYGYVDRISPEAPVPVFRLDKEESRPGMAGNVRANLIQLGCNVNFIHGNTSTKTRLIDIRSKQHIVRIDNDILSESIYPLTTYLYDAIVISDYNKGTISLNLIKEIRQDFDGPIFVDTKKTDLKELQGCIVKINALEYSLLKSECDNLIVTMGSAGARYKDKIYPSLPLEVVDTCGAGDTFLSALCFGYLSNNDIIEAIKFANKAAAITVQHSGVYSPTLEEICDFQEWCPKDGDMN